MGSVVLFSLPLERLFKRMLKTTIVVLLALACIVSAEVSKDEVMMGLMEKGEDGCLVCVDDIMLAVADCSGSEVDLLQCITEALGAASDCLHCICEILAIIGGFDDVCP